MSSNERDRVAPGGTVSLTATLLDATFGFLVWAAHFLAIYIVQATACVFAVDRAAQSAALLRSGLVLGTLIALVLIALHAVRIFRCRSRLADQFLRDLTLGCDGIAAVGVGWQFYPILLLPLCS